MSKDKEYTEQEAKESQEQEQSLQEEQEQEQPEVELSQEELRQLCEQRICPECTQRAEMDKEMLRVRAEAENFRKRMSKEKEQYCKYATEGILEDLIPIIDNLELAVQHGRDLEACKDLVQGVEMTIKMFLETLEKHGLTQVQIQQGDDFDPAWHEAMAQEERSDLEKDQICNVMQKGYKIKDRLLRPAKVVVSKKSET